MPVNESDLKFFNMLSTMQHDEWLRSRNTASTIEQIRKSVKQLSHLVDAPDAIAYEDKFIVVNNDQQIRLRYYHVDDTRKPIIIYFPGNAFIHDLFTENHTIISKIAKHAQCHAVMVECRLAPENPYPKPLEDALTAIEYVASHTEEFNADPEKIILAGLSSGANLASVATNQFRDRSDITIYHQFLISGAYDYTNSLHEFDEFAMQDKMLDLEAAQFSIGCYVDKAQRKVPRCSPYWEKDLSGLPPTTIMVAEYDGGRNQSEGYAQKLKEAGNKVEKLVLPGQTHGTILYRKACCDGQDPAVVAGCKIHAILWDTV